MCPLELTSWYLTFNVSKCFSVCAEAAFLWFFVRITLPARCYVSPPLTQPEPDFESQPMRSGSAGSSAGTSSSSLSPGVFNDIGALFDRYVRYGIANNLSVDEKFAMLSNHIGPPAVFFFHGCQRRFNHS